VRSVAEIVIGSLSGAADERKLGGTTLLMILLLLHPVITVHDSIAINKYKFLSESYFVILIFIDIQFCCL
jgi:hypothetical protein